MLRKTVKMIRHQVTSTCHAQPIITCHLFANASSSDEQVEEDRVSEQHASFELEEQFDRLSVENKCRSAMRLRLHLKEVTTVLLNCPEIATLHVGESKKPLACQYAISSNPIFVI